MIQNSKFKIPNSDNGFSLIEILAVVSIITIVLSITILNSGNFNNSIDLENAAKSVDAKIKLAKSYSIGAKKGTNYGVHFEADKVVIFEGDVFVDGTPTNEVFVFSDKIEINFVVLAGGGSDLVFDRLVGSTGNFGSIGLRVISEPSKTKQIIINSDGQTSLNSFQSSAGLIIENARHAHFIFDWNIQSSTTLNLEWKNSFGGQIAINNINIASYFNGATNKFDWTGSTLVDGVNQEIRIHSWIDDVTGNTVLCVIREQTEENLLHIYTDAAARDIATYNGFSYPITITPGFDVYDIEIL